MFELVRRNNNHVAEQYNPFREMEELERRFFGDAFSGFMGNGRLAEFKTDITDVGDSFILEADLPGFKKENIKLELNGDILTVTAMRNSQSEDKDKNDKVIRSERSFGSYTRHFDVSGINTDAIKCKYEDGVLKIDLPKKEPTTPASRQIEIE